MIYRIYQFRQKHLLRTRLRFEFDKLIGHYFAGFESRPLSGK